VKNPIAQLFGQTAVYGLGIVLPRLLNYLLLTPFYTRVFDRANYGIVTELYAYVVFLLVILTYGMETGYFRFASQNKQKERVYTSVLSSLFVTSALFILLVQVFAPSLARIMDYAEHPEYLRWLAVIVGVDAFTSIPFARIRLQNKAFRYALVRLAEVSVNIALNLFFLWYCPKNSEQIWVDYLYNENVGVGYVFVSNLMASLVKLCLLLPEILGALKQRFDPGLIQRIWRYSYPLLLAGLAGTINEALDRVLLKHLCP